MCFQHGIEDSGAPESRCIMITRTIVDLKNYVDDAKAAEFAEIAMNDKTDQLELDNSCATRLQKLKSHAKSLLSKKNILEYDVLWRYDDVIHPKLHAPYLNKLCKEFHDALKRLVDETVPSTKFDVEPELFEEVLQHWVCCKRKAIKFYGQADLVTDVMRYLKGTTSKPLVVYGESGSGKSTLLSKIATEVTMIIRSKNIHIV
mgnify:CR=1 FL=1